MLDYQSGLDLLSKARKAEKTLKHMTTLRREGEDLAIKYWNTDVVTLHPDGSYTLRNGGYLTQTTKERINEYSPARLYQEKGLWYISTGMRGLDMWNKDNWTLFEDGMKVDSTGKPLNATKGLQKATEHAKKRVDRYVRDYIKGFMADVKENGLREPSGGDCWGCYFVPTGDENAEAMGLDHYFSHFEEKYYVPSLLAKAVKESHPNNPGVVWSMAQGDLAQGREPWLLANALRKYFRVRKGKLVEHLLRQGVKAAA